MSALLPKTNLKSRVLFGALWLSALTALPLTSAATVFTFTKGSSTTFANGNYIQGTLDVNLTTSPLTVNSVNMGVYNSQDVLITSFNPSNGDTRNYTGTCSTQPTGTVYRFSHSGLYLILSSLNTTAPIPQGNEYTAYGGSSLTNTCSSFNPPAAIPTLSEWGMIFMASLLAMFGIRRMRSSK